MTIRTNGPNDREAWLKMWEVGGTVASMCAGQGKKGIWSQFGKPCIEDDFRRFE